MATDILREGKLLALLAHLLVPGKRDWAIKKLAGVGLLNEDCGRLIATALSDTRYNYRNTGARLSNVKAFIDKAVEEHEYCFLNPRRTMQHIRRKIKVAPSSFTADRFQGSVVLDYGCGTLNALSQSIIFIANGASKVFAVEPATTGWEMTRRSALELVKAIFDSPEDFNFTGSPAEKIRSRVASIDFSAIKEAVAENKSGFVDMGQIQMFDWLSDVPPETRFDLMVSTSVLEHVSSLESEVTLQASLLNKDGVALHSVDFTDHRHDDPEYHPFKFYYDGKMKGCNGLRIGQMEGIFKNVGLGVEVADEATSDLSLIDRGRISDRFRSLPARDLATRSATFTLTRQ